MGYALEVWEPERAVLGYTIQAEHMNRTGRLHGGVLATLLDTTMGYSGVYSDEPGGTRACVTLSLTVNFVGAVSEGRLVIEARRTGRRQHDLLLRRRGPRRRRPPRRHRDGQLPLHLPPARGGVEQRRTARDPSPRGPREGRAETGASAPARVGRNHGAQPPASGFRPTPLAPDD